MLSKKLLEAVDQFKTKRIAVFGDVILDRIISGVTNRVSREAPVLIFDKKEESQNLGGAGNTIRNLHSLGVRVLPISLAGKDAYGDIIRKLLNKLSIDTRYILQSSKRTTPIKTRYYAGDNHTKKQQILRVDETDDLEASQSDHDLLISALKREIGHGLDGLIVSDYGVGNISGPIINELENIGNRNSIIIGIDSRYNAFSFNGISFIKPNESEFCEYFGIRNPSNLDIILEKGKNTLNKLGIESILMTRGSEGMVLFENGKTPLIIPEYGTKDIIDGTGAGDTVISVFIMGLICGLLYKESAILANIAGSMVVMKPNAATITQDELEKQIVSPEFGIYLKKHFNEI